MARDLAKKRKRDRENLAAIRAAAKSGAVLPPVDPNEALARRMRATQEENARLRATLTAALKRADKAEDLREGLFNLTSQDLGPVSRIDRPMQADQPHVSYHTPILFTSDFQYGEVIDRAEMDGMNQFDARIFEERYRKMIAKTMQWCDAIKAGWSAAYPSGGIYCRGGDAISGEIHMELSTTNDFGAIPAVRELVRIERDGILELINYWGHVDVYSIPGNHGRNTFKPTAKGYVKNNYETILAWWLADSLAEQRKAGLVRFITPDSGYVRFTAEGWRFEMRHGDRMGAGGGVGWIGSPAPITKGHKKIRLDAATVDAPVDYVMTGHYHTSMKLPRGFANGCMPGYNEFARQLGLDPDSAKQWLIMAHKQRVYGIELELSDFPRMGALS